MAAIGTYRVPREFKDEDRWFRFFTKTQLLIVGIGLGICAVIFLIFSIFGLFIPALILSVVVLAIAGLLAFLPMPDNKYMYGGGYPVYVIALRLINKKFLAKKIVYTKFESEDEL